MWFRHAAFATLGLAAIAAACGGKSPTGPGTIGGTTNLPITEVGNTIATGAVTVAGTSYSVGGGLTVTGSDAGDVTLRLTADLNTAPALLAKVNTWAPALASVGGWGSGFLTNGVIGTDVQLRVTSEGIQDHLNADKKLNTLVRYDAKVGDTYRVTLADGSSITRTVTGVATQDDFQYGMMLIKTITVEQPSKIPGVTKFVYRANHRFGLVWVQAQLEDGTTLSYYLFPQNF
jgi:hypothetical protein